MANYTLTITAENSAELRGTLITLLEGLSDTKARPAHQPAGPAPVQSEVPDTNPAATESAPVPTSTVTYTPDDLARAAMTLMDAGRQPELLALLNQFGVESLPALPQDKYGAFATALRAMGAQI